MANTKEAFDLFDYIGDIDWTRRSSLVKGGLAGLVTVAFFAVTLATLGVRLSSFTYLSILGILEACILGLWLYHRLISVFDTKTMSIGFAIQTDSEEASILYGQLQKAFRQEVGQLRLVDLVRIRKLPSDLRFDKDKAAEKYLMNRGLRVIIWGDTDTVTINRDKVSVFRIKVTYQHQPMDKANSEKLRMTLGRGVRRGVWGIRHDDSLDGLILVGSNVLEISLYTLAVCLISVRQVEFVEHGVKILENLLARLSTKNQDVNFPNLGEVQDQIADLLFSQYSALSTHYLIDKHNPGASYEWAKKAVELHPKDYMANIQAARTAWEIGNEEAAVLYTNKAGSVSPSESLHHLNYGFMRFYEGKYTNGLKQYSKLTNSILAKTNIMEVIEFIERIHDKTHKPALLYAAGWLSVRYGDSSRGSSLLRQFVAENEGDLDLAILIAAAKKQLSQGN